MKQLSLLLIPMNFLLVACHTPPPPDLKPTIQAAVVATLTAQRTEEPTPFTATPIPAIPLTPTFRPIIREPLLIDGKEGRIYATAYMDGTANTVVLSTTNGDLLAVYPYNGRLALDRSNHHLLIDQGQAGIIMLDSMDGNWLGEVKLPVAGESVADPQVDPDDSIAYAFRENTIYVLDTRTKTMITSDTVSLAYSVCGYTQSNAPITHTYYDPFSDRLYVSLTSWACSGFLRDDILLYHYNEAQVRSVAFSCNIASDYQSVLFSENLYITAQDTRLQLLHFLVCGAEWDSEWGKEYIGGSRFELRGIAIDSKRKLLYEDIWKYTGDGWDKQLRISSTDTRQLLSIMAIDTLPVKQARLVGYDLYTDQLYFLDDGKLIIIPTIAILPKNL